MEPSRKGNKKWVIFGIIIAVLAILVAVGPILVTKYMRLKYNNPKNIVKSELMIKVKGVLKQSSDEQSAYLAGENGLFYVLMGDRVEELLENVDKTATVFGKMFEPTENQQIDENPVRLRIEVLNVGYPDLEPINK